LTPPRIGATPPHPHERASVESVAVTKWLNFLYRTIDPSTLKGTKYPEFFGVSRHNHWSEWKHSREQNRWLLGPDSSTCHVE
jgi:hypothetical protein